MNSLKQTNNNNNKLTISSQLFAKWHLFRHDGCLRHHQQVDLLPFDHESGGRVTCDVDYLCANLDFLGLSVLELGPMYATDRRQTDRRQTKASLNISALWGGGIIIRICRQVLELQANFVELATFHVGKSSFKKSSIRIGIPIVTKIYTPASHVWHSSKNFIKIREHLFEIARRQTRLTGCARGRHNMPPPPASSPLTF